MAINAPREKLECRVCVECVALCAVCARACALRLRGGGGERGDVGGVSCAAETRHERHWTEAFDVGEDRRPVRWRRDDCVFRVSCALCERESVERGD